MAALSDSPRRGWLAGVSQAIPIVMGYVPIGLAYGVLAQKAGLSALNTVMMSLIVFAGSSQFIAVGLFAAGAPAVSIILTTFVVNLRHLLMSAAISPFLKSWRSFQLAAFAYQLTDETFAVHVARFASLGPDKAEAFVVNVSAQSAWVLGTTLGVMLGRAIADVEPLGLDYALPAMFIALLVMQIQHRLHVGVACLAGAAAVGMSLMGIDQWSVIIATVLGATAGVIGEQWINKPSS
ncbi:MAG: AzlC family ABC transporter permease [Thermoflexales bacterium]|nr:AzlC family ABC transporter permease [Thermoflexales bacterium]